MPNPRPYPPEPPKPPAFPDPVPRPPRGPVDDSGEQRQAALKESRHRERVMAALDWLTDHQDIEGFWSADGFRKSSRRADAKTTGNVEFVKPGELDADFGWADAEVGVTGLAMMAFTAAGFDHREGEYRQPLRSGLQYLRRVQHNDGCFGPKEEDQFVYHHAFATIAVAELYRITGDAVLKPMVDRACEFILRAQNPGLGWRYGVQPGMNDTSVTGVMLAALKAAQAAGTVFQSSEASIKDAMAWLKMVTVEVNDEWKTGYEAPGTDNARLRSALDYRHNATMDAIHGACRGLWSRPDERYTPDFVARLARKDALPRWEHLHVDFYYWYWAATYARLQGGDLWKSWDTQASRVLKASQRGWHIDDLVAGLTSAEKLAEHGSWDPVGAWGSAGGRVYSTAVGALILQTEWRVKEK